MKKKKPNLVIYHANCADGFCAAWIARMVLGEDETVFYAAHYGNSLPKTEGRNVYMLDFSAPLETIEDIAEKCNRLVILDHHKTCEDDLRPIIECPPDNVTIVYDNTKCGARLTWEFFFPEDPSPPIVDYVEDRDLWKWELPHSREISAFISSHNKDFLVWDVISGMEVDSVISEGAGILRYQKQCVDTAVSKALPIIIDGYEVLAVNVAESSLISDVAGELAHRKAFGATYFFIDEETIQWSLRSREDGIDVSEVAKKFGGGGHRNAAGFRTKINSPIAQLVRAPDS